MKNMKRKVSDTIGALVIFSAMASIIGMFCVYIMCYLALPAVVIWAIYQMVTHMLR